jgi:hypothetical protein
MLRLPPPDPNELLHDPPGLSMTAPAAVYLSAPITAADDRLANAILTARPGALIVTG